MTLDTDVSLPPSPRIGDDDILIDITPPKTNGNRETDGHAESSASSTDGDAGSREQIEKDAIGQTSTPKLVSRGSLPPFPPDTPPTPDDFVDDCDKTVEV